MIWLGEWLELAVRWLHVVAGIAWIGSSFYFNWLEGRLHPPESPAEGVAGELWAVHGGGFYRVHKFDVAPPRMPGTLHWFKWEAYTTWLSGFALLALVYYLGAEVWLVRPGSPVGPEAAVAIGVGTLGIGWLVYDRLCRSPLARRPLLLGLAGLGLVAAAAYGLARVLDGRAAYIHVGALLGTIMAANVFFVIIPAHRDLVDAVEEGRTPDAAVGRHAAMRSLHNNYLTLPVVFAMISNHYPLTYGHAWDWAVLVALFGIGVAARHHFNLRNRGRSKPWLLPAAGLALLALALVSRAVPGPGGGRGLDAAGLAASGDPPSFEDARGVILRRCVVCHSAHPAHRLFEAPPGGVTFDTPEQIRRHAGKIYEFAVASEAMPLGNFTGMTAEERWLLGAWIRAEAGGE